MSMYAVSGKVFLSTPSARRATRYRVSANSGTEISIHALREEGDPVTIPLSGNAPIISIHALREEGDIAYALIGSALTVFLSTPSARRATCGCC